jgi:hypothetical protein
MLRLHILKSKLISIVYVVSGRYICSLTKRVFALSRFPPSGSSSMLLELLAKQVSIDLIAIRHTSTFDSSNPRLG